MFPAELTPQTVPSSAAPMSDKPPGIWIQGLAGFFTRYELWRARLTTRVRQPPVITLGLR